MKRGISNIIASVLLVLIVVAAVIIVWLLLLPFLYKNFNSYDLETVIKVHPDHTFLDEKNGLLNIQIESAGSVSPEYLQTIIGFDDGSEVISVNDAPLRNHKMKYSFDLFKSPGKKPVSISFAAIFDREGKITLGERRDLVDKVGQRSGTSSDYCNSKLILSGYNNVSKDDLDEYSTFGSYMATVAASSEIVFVTPPTPANEICSNADPIQVEVDAPTITEEMVLLNFDNSLVLWLRMDDYDGNNVYDSSNYGNDGVSGNPHTPVSGQHGSAFEFNTADKIINVSDCDSLDISQQITLAVWIRVTNPEQNAKIIIKSSSNFNADPWEVYVLDIMLKGAGFYPRFLIGNDVKYSEPDEELFWIVADSEYSVNTWYHIVGVFDGTDMVIYVNGNEQNRSAVNSVKVHAGAADFTHIGNSNQSLLVGGLPTNALTIDGQIDEVMVFNRGLSTAEVKSLYDSSVNPYDTTISVSENKIYSYQAIAVDSTNEVHKSEVRRYLKV